jgi:hypothetical protein
MKSYAFRFAAVLGAVAALLTGCTTVVVKKPAGDEVPVLDPKIWEGTWRGSDEARCVSKIKDAAQGLVEVRSKSPGEDEETFHLKIRQLKERLVATAVPGPGESVPADAGAAFFRISITEDYVALFVPREALFKDAVQSGKIAGYFREGDRSKNQLAQNMTTLNQFGGAEVDKLPLANKDSCVECFEPDPVLVMIRLKPRTSDSGKSKRP